MRVLFATIQLVMCPCLRIRGLVPFSPCTLPPVAPWRYTSHTFGVVMTGELDVHYDRYQSSPVNYILGADQSGLSRRQTYTPIQLT
jgi:hypothetical protein